jgi:hypothetical protein
MQLYLGFITRSLRVSGTCFTHLQEYNTEFGSHWYNILRWIVKCKVTSTLKIVQKWAGGHITVVELELVTTGM